MGGPSIRLRLTAWNGGVLAAILVGLGLAVHAILAHALLERIDASLGFEYREFIERVREGGHPRLPTGHHKGRRNEEARSRVLHDRAHPEDIFPPDTWRHAPDVARSSDPGTHLNLPETFLESYLVSVSDSAGRVLLESPELHGIRLRPPRHDARGRPHYTTLELGKSGSYRMIYGTVRGAHGLESIRILFPMESYHDQLSELRKALLTILPAGLLAAVAGGYWLAGRSLAPVHRMTETARRITADNLHERIAVANPWDELGRLAATINAMLDRLDRTFADMRQFTADASHELKTPLASIRAEAEITLQAPRTQARHEEVLRSIVEEADRLTRLADHLLLLAREDADASPEDLRPIRLDVAVREAGSRISGTAERAGVDLHIAELPVTIVEGDHDRLRRVFDNLLDNAVKYNHAGGSVNVRGRSDGDRAVVEVSDTGIGIPAAIQARVFDRFYRVDPSRSRRTGGTGLGLSIAKALVESMRGRLEVESTPGKGSTFRVTLPLVRNS